jgi:hypothetical protein
VSPAPPSPLGTSTSSNVILTDLVLAIVTLISR